jgi:AmiR/NasT family two-component response regulator
MTAQRTPTFAGWQGLILAPEDKHTQRLARHLGLLGIQVLHQTQPLDAAQRPDLIVIDADQGQGALLEQHPSECPVVALLSSEAPGRIAWALRQGAGAFIPKPVPVSAIYPALVLAHARHAERADTARRIAWLEERLRLRPVVFAALTHIKAERGMDDEQAYALLRECAMRRRLALEQIAAMLLNGSEPLREVG